MLGSPIGRQQVRSGHPRDPHPLALICELAMKAEQHVVSVLSSMEMMEEELLNFPIEVEMHLPPPDK